MLTENIYRRFFNGDKIEKGYADCMEFMDELYAALDVLLHFALEINTEFAVTLNSKEINVPGEFMDRGRKLLKEAEKHIRGRMEASKDEGLLTFSGFSEAMGLSGWQRFCLLLGGACLKSAAYGEYFAVISAGPQPVCASVGLALFLYKIAGGLALEDFMGGMEDEEFRRMFFQEGRMPETSVSFREHPLKLREHLFAHFYGGDRIIQGLEGKLTLYRGENRPEKLLLYQEQLESLVRLLDYQRPDAYPVILLQGRKGSGRRELLKNLVYLRKHNVLFIDYQTVLAAENRDELLHILCLEAVLHRACLCLCGVGPDDGEIDKIIRLKNKYHLMLFFTSEESMARRLLSYGNVYELMLPAPEAGDRVVLWEYFLKICEMGGNVEAVKLGNKYFLNAGEIKDVLENAVLSAQGEGRADLREEDIRKAVKQYNGNFLDSYAEPVETVYQMRDLVAEKEVIEQLGYICSRMAYRSVVGSEWGFLKKTPYGKGICALFYGPPGTGKTMAAQVLANELGLDLYRIDLSRMVSKYIGETQKNISGLFEKAGHMNAVLFFDEADALFARRTEVGDSNDRHANSEVAHLLQKLEEYEGISILATNLRDNIDDAFKRRIKYMVHFQLPDEADRNKLWSKMLPPEAPVEEDLDLGYFAAHFELTGSEIKEAMLHAAFCAAKENCGIGNRHIIDALRLNFAKYGRILTQEEFGYLV